MEILDLLSSERHIRGSSGWLSEKMAFTVPDAAIKSRERRNYRRASPLVLLVRRIDINASIHQKISITS